MFKFLDVNVCINVVNHMCSNCVFSVLFYFSKEDKLTSMHCLYHAEAFEYKKEALVRGIHTISEMVKGGDHLHLQERMEMPRGSS